ncbi:hypothetical protein PVAG01_05974 [Phlyctema vagabunda]|uniref:Uncharacterized protein n=1 Tax=Phlyctema vagabunda TaxID=108571 RepID=A0ABR4PER5_9HELO
MPPRRVPPPKRSAAQLREDLSITTATKKGYISKQTPTEREYLYMRYLWEEYKTDLENPNLLLDIMSAKAFFKNLVYSRLGRIGERLSIHSLDQYAIRLAVCCKREGKGDLSPSDRKELASYFRSELKDEFSLSSKRRQKPQMDLKDLEKLLYFLWAEDEHKFTHMRGRVQLAFYLLLLVYTASRPGAVVVSDAYRNTNQALKYKVGNFGLP